MKLACRKVFEMLQHFNYKTNKQWVFQDSRYLGQNSELGSFSITCLVKKFRSLFRHHCQMFEWKWMTDILITWHAMALPVLGNALSGWC